MNVKVDTKNLDVGVRFLAGLARDQEPFALSLTINRLGDTFQKEQRRAQGSVFTVRRPLFVNRAVKRKPKATKRRPWTIVAIDPPGGQERADILTKFEEDRVKRPFTADALAVPGPGVRRGKTGVISRRQRPKAFNFREVSPRVAIGERRTFLIRTGRSSGYIFQRVGRGKRSRVKLLYTLVPQVPIDPELGFQDRAWSVVRRDTGTEYARALDHALRTAKR